MKSVRGIPNKAASYSDAVEYVALNDDSSELDPEKLLGTISIMLVASIFDIDPPQVVKDIIAFRKEYL